MIGRVLWSMTIFVCVVRLSLPAEAEEPYHLLLITLDTMRADYMSLNGSKHVQTPNLDRLARGGVNFTRARAPVPLTLPSHASILTGNYPPTHGVRDNGGFRLPVDQRTLAEVLEDHGYETSAFVGAFVLDRRFGLSRGFHVYDDRTWSDISMLENLEAERNADAVYGAFSRWLKNTDGKKPLFAWVHFYDPHAPYTPPEPFKSRYADHPYAGEVAYVDEAVGKILLALEERGMTERTLVAIVGDHGEGLGEHDEKSHSVLIYNSTLHVPMLIYKPGLVPVGRVVPDLTSIIDLAPTLLDYLGISDRLGRGASLRSLMEGKETEEDRVAYGESLYPSLNLGWSALKGLESERYRFILAPTLELYDLESDPGEKKNLAATRGEIVKGMTSRLEELLENMGAEESRSSQTIDPETQAMLRSLGYISGSKPPSSSSVADPKDKMDVWNQIQLGTLLFGQEQYRSALETLLPALTSEQDNPMVYEYIGSCHMRLEQWSEAETVYRQALGRGLESPDFHLNLGLVYFHRKDLAKAEKELELALAMDSLSVEAHYRLGEVHRTAKRYETAIEQYRHALEINPSYVYALNGLGMTLATIGRNNEAFDAFQTMVSVDPNGPRGYFNLGALLERMRRREEALEAYHAFLSLSSEEEFSRERERAKSAIERLGRQR